MLKDPEFIKYAKWVLGGFVTVGGTHEGLSYFKGKPGQFYEKPAKLSLTGYVRKRKKSKLDEKLKQDEGAWKLDEKAWKLKKKLMEEENCKNHEDKMKQLLEMHKNLKNDEELNPIFQKIKELHANALLKTELIPEQFGEKKAGTEMAYIHRLDEKELEILKSVLVVVEVSEKEFQKICEYVSLYICCGRYQGYKFLMLAFCSKGDMKYHEQFMQAANDVCDIHQFFEIADAFALLTASMT